MGKHTPGPWHVGVGGNLHANRVWTADMQPVAMLCSFGSSPADIDTTAQANARLIAAAPELLAALKAIVAETGMSSRLKDAASAAIAKVEAS